MLKILAFTKKDKMFCKCIFLNGECVCQPELLLYY